MTKEKSQEQPAISKAVVSQCIENFRQHLISGFQSVSSAYELAVANDAKHACYDEISFDDFFADWSQSNWELLVERPLCSTRQALVIYGDGSDYEASKYSRVFYRTLAATHIIQCLPIGSVVDAIAAVEVDISKYEFHSLVTMKDEWFDIAPPFDYVLLEEKSTSTTNYQQIAVSLEQVEFTLENRIDVTH